MYFVAICHEFMCQSNCVLFSFSLSLSDEQITIIEIKTSTSYREKKIVFGLPEICEKHCVSVVTTNPDERAVANNTDETDAPTPAPAAAPHTMNTYKNDAKHSAIIDL